MLKAYLAKHGHVLLIQVLQTWFHIDMNNDSNKKNSVSIFLFKQNMNSFPQSLYFFLINIFQEDDESHNEDVNSHTVNNDEKPMDKNGI